MLDNYVGQRDALAPLLAAIAASRKTGRPLPNMLFLGGPGRGKTTLAKAVAHETGQKFVTLHGSSTLERAAVTEKILEAEGGTLFIDEVHALPRQTAEDLYRVIDERKVTILVPKMETKWQKETFWADTVEQVPPELRWIWEGQGAGYFTAMRPYLKPTKEHETQTVEVSSITIIGATTDEALLPEPFYSRLSALTVRLREYTTEELADIASKRAEFYGMFITPRAAETVAQCSRKTPRRVEHLTDRAGNFAVMNGSPQPSGDYVIDHSHVEAALSAMGIDSLGLEEPHRAILGYLARAEKGLSRTTLAQSVGIPMRNLDTYWGDLVGLGLVEIQTRHQITERGRQAL